jgi:hypothetical protein
VRPVNFRNGRKFDTCQNSDDLAQVLVSDSRKSSTLDPATSRRRRIPPASKNTR